MNNTQIFAVEEHEKSNAGFDSKTETETLSPLKTSIYIALSKYIDHV